MTCVHWTRIVPRPGHESEVLALLEELDARLDTARGLIASFVFQNSEDYDAVSVWRSTNDADREALSERTLALRSRILYISTHAEEQRLLLRSGHLADADAGITEGRGKVGRLDRLLRPRRGLEVGSGRRTR